MIDITYLWDPPRGYRSGGRDIASPLALLYFVGGERILLLEHGELSSVRGARDVLVGGEQVHPSWPEALHLFQLPPEAAGAELANTALRAPTCIPKVLHEAGRLKEL